MMKLAPLIVLACLVVVFLIVCGASFLSPKNIMNILNQMALPLVVALGLTFVIMLGSIDLSIDGSVGMAGSLFACFVLNSEFAYDLGFLSVVIAVGVSMLCGLLIGLCHVYLKIPSFMASFAFMYICKGIGMVSYQGHPPTDVYKRQILRATICYYIVSMQRSPAQTGYHKHKVGRGQRPFCKQGNPIQEGGTPE